MDSHPPPNKTHKTSETDAVQDWCIPFDFQKEHKEKYQWKIYSNHLHPMQNEQELRSQSIISNSAI